MERYDNYIQRLADLVDDVERWFYDVREDMLAEYLANGCEVNPEWVGEFIEDTNSNGYWRPEDVDEDEDERYASPTAREVEDAIEKFLDNA